MISLLLISLCPLVSAWTTDTWSGVWSDSTLPRVSDSGSGHEGYINSTGQDISGLNASQGYELDIYVNDLSAYWDYWTLAGHKQFFLALDLESTTSGSDVWGMFYLGHENRGIYNTSQCKVGVNQFDSGVFWNFPDIPTHDTVYRIRIIKINDTTIMLSYQMPDKNDVLTMTPVLTYEAYNETFTVPSNFWDDLDAYLYIGHHGNGEFDIEFSDLVFYDSIEGFEKHFTNPVQWIYDGVNFLMGVVGALSGAVGAFLPVLPFFLIFWFLDAGIASAQQGSITPVGNAIKTVIEWLSVVWGYLVEFGKLIWDVITFWT